MCTVMSAMLVAHAYQVYATNGKTTKHLVWIIQLTVSIYIEDGQVYIMVCKVAYF